MKTKEISNVKLIKAKPKGYFLQVSDGMTENRLAITKYELLLIWKVVEKELKLQKEEIKKVIKNEMEQS